MRRMTVPSTRTIAWATALSGALATAIALIAEHWLEFAPCALCLWERWPHRVLISLGPIAAVLPRGPARAPCCGSPCWSHLSVEAALAALHLGVESSISGPARCPNADRAAIHRRQHRGYAEGDAGAPREATCDSRRAISPPFLPVSMVAMNLLYAAAFTLQPGFARWWRTRRHST